MNFSGLQKTTLIDYPGQIACTLFTAYCNMRCPFCHNAELIIPGNISNTIEWKIIYDFLKKRKHLLGGVCITGGEPLLHYEQLVDVIHDIHSLGLKVKIDTNGTFPERLIKLDVDFIAMDLKTSLDKYHLLGYQEKKDVTELIRGSIEYIIDSKKQYEFRTTIVPQLVTQDDIKKICGIIPGAKKYVLSQFRPKKTLDQSYEQISPYPYSILEQMKKIVDGFSITCEIRANY